MNSVCLDYEKVDFLANLLIPTLARHPISNSFPERGLALKESTLSWWAGPSANWVKWKITRMHCPDSYRA